MNNRGCGGCVPLLFAGAFLLLLLNFIGRPDGSTLMPLLVLVILTGLFIVLVRWYVRALRLRAEEDRYPHP